MLGTGICFTLISWCVKKKGPQFASIFNPLMLVIVALFGSLLLDEKLHLGRKTRPPMTRMILLQAFGSGLFGGSLTQNLNIVSISFTSSTFAAAMLNLIPAITFVMALVFRMGRLQFTTMTGKAKMVGTLTGIGGAMLLTFYKGAEINIWSSSLHVNLAGHHSQADHPHAAVESGSRVMGSLLAVACCFSYAIWLILQAKMNEAYPSLYSSTTLMCLMGSIQVVVFALFMERDWSSWALGWNIRLLMVFYVGVKMNIWPSSLHVNLAGHHSHTDHPHAAVESGSRVMGSLLAVVYCFSYAIWLIL